MATQTCQGCEAEFQTEQRYVDRGNGLYCSRACSSKAAARASHYARRLEQRYWKRVIRRGDEECWDWSAFKYRGYGRLHTSPRAGASGHTTTAHRVSWEIHNGPIPEGMIVCHKCDNPSCSNPKHLFLGTIADNNADRDAKGRVAKGENSSSAVLTAEIVLRLKSLPPENYVDRVKAATWLGVSESTIRSVIDGRTWGHVE